MIRVAKFGDIPRIVKIMQDVLAGSAYATKCEIDVKEAKRLVFASIQRHGAITEGGTFVAVAVKDDVVEGYIIGVLQRFYGVTDALEATDYQWLCTKNVNPRDPIKLVKAMHKWAASVPKCIAVFQATIDTVVDHEKVSRALEAIGMTRCGNVLRKELHQ